MARKTYTREFKLHAVRMMTDQGLSVTGARWAVNDLFELAKGDFGLGEYEVLSWTGWHRHVTLSVWALAVVAVIRSRVPAPTAVKMRRAADPAERARG